MPVPAGPATTYRDLQIEMIVPVVIPTGAPPPDELAVTQLQVEARKHGHVLDPASVEESAPRVPYTTGSRGWEPAQPGTPPTAWVRTYTGRASRVQLPDPEVVRAEAGDDPGRAAVAVDLPAGGRVEVAHPLDTERIGVRASGPDGEIVWLLGWLSLDEAHVEVQAGDEPVAHLELWQLPDDDEHMPGPGGADHEDVGTREGPDVVAPGAGPGAQQGLAFSQEVAAPPAYSRMTAAQRRDAEDAAADIVTRAARAAGYEPVGTPTVIGTTELFADGRDAFHARDEEPRSVTLSYTVPVVEAADQTTPADRTGQPAAQDDPAKGPARTLGDYFDRAADEDNDESPNFGALLAEMHDTGVHLEPLPAAGVAADPDQAASGE